jgi:urea transporter
MNVLTLLGTCPFSKRYSDSAVLFFIDCTLRGISQVFFCDNPITGIVFLVGIVIESWYLFSACLIGATFSTATAFLLGFDRARLASGLFGYAGTLASMGIAYFSFGSMSDPYPVPFLPIFMAVAAAFAAVVSGALGTVFGAYLGIPTFTLPFHLAAWSWLCVSQMSSYFHVNGNMLQPKLASVFSAQPVAWQDARVSYEADLSIRACFTGVSQVFFLDNPYSGAIFVVAMAVTSRLMAAACLGGSSVGVLFAMAIGIASKPLYMGLWGYNPCLTAIALSVFLVPRLHVRYISWMILACLMTVLAHAATNAFLTPIGMPAFTFPFTVVCYAVTLCAGTAKDLVAIDLSVVTIPEDHVLRFRLCEYVVKQLPPPIAKSFTDSLQFRLTSPTVDAVDRCLVPALLCSYASHGMLEEYKFLLSILPRNPRLIVAFDGRTPLHCAVTANQPQMVSMLLQEYHVDPYATDALGKSPLADALLLGLEDMVRLLVIDHAVLLRESVSDDMLAFWVLQACRDHNVSFLRLCTLAGCDVASIRDADGRCPLDVAQQENAQHVLQFLNPGADNPSCAVAVDACNELSQVSQSVSMSSLNSAGSLSSSSLNTEACLLDVAVAPKFRADAELVCSLCVTDANRARLQTMKNRHTLVTDEGRSLMHVAAASGARGVLKDMLASVGPALRLHVVDAWGVTPAMNAAFAHQYSCFSLLSCSSSSSSFITNGKHGGIGTKGMSLFVKSLVFARVAQGCPSIALLLSARILSPDLVDYDGRSMLHVAVSNRQTSLIETLVRDYAVNVAAVDRMGRTAYDIAMQRGYTHLLSLLTVEA